jgi:hypothetical protein
MLNEKHGHRTFTGNAERDREKHFTFYEASAEITSEDTAVIYFYGMEDSVLGGRGPLEVEKKAKALKIYPSFQKLVERRKVCLVTESILAQDREDRIRRLQTRIEEKHYAAFNHFVSDEMREAIRNELALRID